MATSPTTPRSEWKSDPRSPAGIFMGSFKLPLPGGKEPVMVGINAYRFPATDAARASLKNTLLYYADYAYVGDITIGGNAYHAVLTNDMSDGDFRGANSATGRSGVRLMIDLNNDGKFDSRAETFDARKPFNIKGTTWELADLAAPPVISRSPSPRKRRRDPPPAGSFPRARCHRLHGHDDG